MPRIEEGERIRKLIEEAAKKMGISVEEYLKRAVEQKGRELSKKQPYNGIRWEGEIGIH